MIKDGSNPKLKNVLMFVLSYPAGIPLGVAATGTTPSPETYVFITCVFVILQALVGAVASWQGMVMFIAKWFT